MLKQKKCKYCSEMFMQQRPLQYVCSPRCGAELAISGRKKRINKERAEAKKTLLTHSDWIQFLQKVFNTWIKLRDKNRPCISCLTTSNVQYAAGHLWPTTYQFLRFHEDNVWKQCNKNCNLEKSGNVGEYRINLIKLIGEERVKWLDDNRHRRLELSIPEIQEKIKYYKQKIKQLK